MNSEQRYRDHASIISLSRNAWSEYAMVSSTSVIEIRKRSQVREQISRWSINAVVVITVPLPYNVITLNGTTEQHIHRDVAVYQSAVILPAQQVEKQIDLIANIYR